MRTIYLNKQPMELYKILKFESLAASGGEAKMFISDGQVRLNGQVETQKRKKVMAGDIIEFNNEEFQVTGKPEGIPENIDGMADENGPSVSDRLSMNHTQIENQVRKWVDTFVVDLNLCPFAKRELVNNRVRFCVSEAVSEDQLRANLNSELELLVEDSSIETTLLIHPQVLQDFHDYNQFLDVADALLIQVDLQGVFQVASFHPLYQFDGTLPEDAENYTNKSPYPMLHLLREESLTRAIDSYPHSDLIPEQNVKRLRSLGAEKLSQLLRDCSKP